MLLVIMSLSFLRMRPRLVSPRQVFPFSYVGCLTFFLAHTPAIWFSVLQSLPERHIHSEVNELVQMSTRRSVPGFEPRFPRLFVLLSTPPPVHVDARSDKDVDEPCIQQYDMIRYDTIRYDTIRYDTIRYDTIRYDTIRYDTIRYDTIRYDTIRYNKL